MIIAKFNRTAAGLLSATVSGHAGYAPAGEDVVCAAVSSAVQLTANALTEVLGTDAGIDVSENSVSIVRGNGALGLGLGLLAEEYPGTIKVTISEV